MKDVTEMGNSNRYNTERPMVPRVVKTCGLGKDRRHLGNFVRISSYCSLMHDEYGLCPPLDMTACVFSRIRTHSTRLGRITVKTQEDPVQCYQISFALAVFPSAGSHNCLSLGVDTAYKIY